MAKCVVAYLLTSTNSTISHARYQSRVNVRLGYLISKKLTPDSIKVSKNWLAHSCSLGGFLHSPDLLTVLDEAVTGYRRSVEKYI